MSVLQRHLSALNAQLVLDRALQRCALEREALQAGDLNTLLPEVERGAQLFIDIGRRVRFRTDLRAAVTAPSAPAQVRMPITLEADISHARAAAKRMCEELGASSLAVQKVATVVSELARNIVEYTKGGTIELIPYARPRRMVVRAVDDGSGISNLNEILEGRYRSKTGLGIGLRGSKRLMDRFDIETGAAGTRIEAEVRL